MKLVPMKGAVLRAKDIDGSQAVSLWAVTVQTTYGWLSDGVAHQVLVLAHDAKQAKREALADHIRNGGQSLDVDKHVAAVRIGCAEPAEDVLAQVWREVNQQAQRDRGLDRMQGTPPVFCKEQTLGGHTPGCNCPANGVEADTLHDLTCPYLEASVAQRAYLPAQD